MIAAHARLAAVRRYVAEALRADPTNRTLQTLARMLEAP